jgi:hypothetical protein
MNNFRLLNVILGWVTFVVALVVYSLTLEPSVSLWDCGEFISASYKLQVVHPPGAPLFLMIGRLFSLMAAKPEDVGFWVNMLSAVSSAGCVMFTFWITTHFAGRIVDEDRPNRNILILGAGLVAALTNTFLDSFWFSAVEAEVYALSSFFTALTFWAILRWDKAADKPGADRWLIFIGFITGLALGTHMLNLLVIPAICLAYYFRRFTITTKGILYAFGTAVLALGFVMKIIYPGIPWLISRMDKMFVNDFGLPFYSGAITGMIIIFAGLAYLIWFAHSKGRYNLNILALSITFVILGYSSYTMVIIRSMANPAIDMNNPEDPYKFYGYITREQYGDRPLVKGPYFNAPQTGFSPTYTKYFKGDSLYEEGGFNYEPEFDETYNTLFPRMGRSGKPNDAKGYREWGGMSEVQAQIESMRARGKLTQQDQEELQMLEYQKPSFGNNMQFFFRYQIGYMYMRYFMWNFVGRFNDQQATSGNTKLDGNWYSGIPLIDNYVVGPKKNMPEYYKSQKAKNAYYFLPLFLGLLGAFVHASKKRKDFWLVTTLFLFTGILINVYMNQPPYEPRERDYSLVGSFQTFCIWIGLGVIAVADLLNKYLNKNAAIASAAACTLLVPVNMGYQNWDDHDRSQRYIGIHMAKNFLEGLAPNAILFCNGDNDTYPLWYAQNVEGVRTDVRIINQSLLPTEWYSSVLLDKVYESDPLPLTVTKEDLQTGSFEYGIQIDKTSFKQPRPMRTIISELLADNRKNGHGSDNTVWRGGSAYIKVDKDAVIKSGVVNPKDKELIPDSMLINISGNYLSKGDVVVYDLITTNAEKGWKRPIYFTSVSGYDFNFLNSYLRLEGMVYRFTPIPGGLMGGEPKAIDDYRLYNNLVNKYKYYGMKEKKNFFLDDKASYVLSPDGGVQRWALLLSRYYQNEISMYDQYKKTIDSGKDVNPPAGFKDPKQYLAFYKDSMPIYRKRAVDVINEIITEIPESISPLRRDVKMEFGMVLLDLGEEKLAKDMLTKSVKDCAEFIQYFKRWEEENWAIREVEFSKQISQQIIQTCKVKGKQNWAAEFEGYLRKASI